MPCKALLLEIRDRFHNEFESLEKGAERFASILTENLPIASETLPDAGCELRNQIFMARTAIGDAMRGFRKNVAFRQSFIQAGLPRKVRNRLVNDSRFGWTWLPQFRNADGDIGRLGDQLFVRDADDFIDRSRPQFVEYRPHESLSGIRAASNRATEIFDEFERDGDTDFTPTVPELADAGRDLIRDAYFEAEAEFRDLPVDDRPLVNWFDKASPWGGIPVDEFKDRIRQEEPAGWDRDIDRAIAEIECDSKFCKRRKDWVSEVSKERMSKVRWTLSDSYVTDPKTILQRLDEWREVAKRAILCEIAGRDHLAWRDFRREPWPHDFPALRCHTAFVISWVRNHHSLDTGCYKRVAEAAETWLFDKNANRLPEQKSLELELQVAEASIWLAMFPLMAKVVLPNPKRRPHHIQHWYVHFAVWVRDQCWNLEKHWPGESPELYRFRQAVFPTYSNTNDTRLAIVLSEARRNNELALHAPMLKAIEGGLEDITDRLVYREASRPLRLEPSALTNSLNELIPYLRDEEEPAGVADSERSDGIDLASTLHGDATETGHEATDKSNSPDATGYVARPSDPNAYVLAKVIRQEYTDEDQSLSENQLTTLLVDFQNTRVRWTRPLTKQGTPNKQRKSVHLADWEAHRKRKTNVDAEGFPNLSVTEIESRTAGVKGGKQRRK